MKTIASAAAVLFLLGTGVSDWLPLGYAAVVSVFFFLAGLLYFSHYERKLADVV